MPVQSPIFSPSEVIRVLRGHYRLWLIPAVAGLVLAGLYVVFAPGDWQAVQTLVVRNEALRGEDTPGNFRQENEMKVAQETIIEIARSRSVVTKALAEVGPPADCSDAANWPSEQDIADLQDAVEISPPQGAEFGKTEILYVKIKHGSRERAVALVKAVCNQLQTGMRNVREAKAQGLIDELTKVVALAETDLAEVTAKIAKIETEVGGSDLADLRMLDQTAAGDSDLRRKITTIETELREASVAQQANKELLKTLEAAYNDPDQVLAAPNRLLESQPALRRLKEGLVDAQLRTAQLQGTMTAEHPQVLSAQTAEEQVRQQLHNELLIAAKGVKSELRVTNGRIELLETQLADSRGRLDALAGIRAEYSNLVAAARHQNTLAEKARKDLADARGSQASAASGSMIGLIDQPSAGNRRVGPRRSLVLAAGLLGGLVTGLGLVFLTVPLPSRTVGTNGHFQPSSNGNLRQPAGYGLSLTGALRKVAERNSTRV
jgi:uncharacterized protein involved in exopolysaccharide biosynthesis